MRPESVEGFRFSPQQRRAWEAWPAGGGVSRFAVRVAGEVAEDELKRALEGVMARHDILLTHYRRLEGMVLPVQVVNTAPVLEWKRQEGGGNGSAPDLESLLREAGARPFDLESGPTVRAAFVDLGKGGRVVVVSLPVLAADGRSVHNLISDLERGCRGAADEAASTDGEGVSYPQFSEFQSLLYEGEEGAEARDFWRREELVAPPPVALPFAFPGGSARAEPERCSRPLEPELAASIAAAASAAECPLPAWLLTAWHVLLARLGGHQEVVVAHLFEGRTHEIFKPAVGLFARWVPVACDVDRAVGFRRLVERIARMMARAEAAAEGFLWPAGSEMEASHGPSVGFTFERWPAPGTGARLTLLDHRMHHERCGLGLLCIERDGGLHTVLEHDPERFAASDIEQLHDHLHRLLEAASESPELPVGRLPLLTSEERCRQVMELNADERFFPANTGWHRRFEEQVEKTAGAPALVYEGAPLTYRQLDRRSNRLARFLRGCGVGPDVPVALVLERSTELVVALLAVLKAGGAYVVLDPSQPPRRLGYMLEDLGAPVILTGSEAAAELPPYAGRVVRMDADREEIESFAGDVLAGGAGVSNLAYVVFTSGSTGRPKGVMVEHRQLLSYTRAALERLEFAAGARFAVVSTFAADLGHTMVFPALATGGCLHVVSQERAADPAELAAYFEEHRIDYLKIVPSHMEALIDSPNPERLMPGRALVFGGEALRPATAEEMRRLAPECAVFNHYGPSETTVGVIAHRIDGEADQRCGSVPLGSPLAKTWIYLLDDRLEPIPDWVDGELYIAGGNVTRGYLGRPAMTAERYVPNPFATQPGGRLYRTGDLVRQLPGGELEFRGRVDHQVKFHGFRVELEEIRGALNRHGEVRDNVVAIKADPHGRELLVAYYVSRQPQESTELRAHLAQTLLEETLPNLYVHLRRLPLTLNGKLNYEALPSVEEALQQMRRPWIAPRNSTEELLAEIWGQVLGVKRVSVEDNFFDLGGHSLRATQVVSRLRRSFGINLSLRSLFETPNLAQLAEEVDRQLVKGGKDPLPPIRPVPRSEPLPLSFAQERLWFMDQLRPGNPVYNILGAQWMTGELDSRALHRSFERIVDRHEALRSRILNVEGQGRQEVLEKLDLPLMSIDLSSVPEDRCQSELERVIRRESRRPFVLERGPLIRLHLIRLGMREHALLINVHHIVVDGWSLGVILRELTDLYAALRAGQPPVLRELPVQYADYAVWQRRWIEKEARDWQLSYWERRLRGAPERLDLPTDRPRPEAPSYRGGYVRFELPPELCRTLRRMSQEHGLTLFMILLAAFKVMLNRYTGQEDVVVGTDIANRNRLETEGLVGFLVNNLVLRTDLSGDPSFHELLDRVRETTLEAYAHQDLPFELLVKRLKPLRHLSQMPLFQVLFVVQNARRSKFELPGLRTEVLRYRRSKAKFDLALFVRERGEKIFGTWNYSSDLFDPPTVERMRDHYQNLLARLCGQPELHLSEVEMDSEGEKKHQTLRREGRRLAKMKGLRRARRKTVDLGAVEVVKTGFLDHAAQLPMVVEPNLERVDLVAWLADHRERLDEDLLRCGAVLLRGFAVHSVEGFEAVARAACDSLYGEYGDLPSEEKGEKIYHSTPYPADKMILFHNESSHLDRWPTRQFFCCLTASREGGQTPIVDCRELYQRLDPELREKFERVGLMYRRSFTDGLDVSWQSFFHTDDRAEVERRCCRAGMEHEWREDGLTTRQVCDAVVRHPRTGDKLFFNQVQLHHPCCLDPETRDSMLEVFGGKALPRDVCYGDGTPIEDSVMERISELYEELAVEFPWLEGDVLVLDNMRIAHARRPFAGPRKIVVAMGDLLSRDELHRAATTLGGAG